MKKEDAINKDNDEFHPMIKWSKNKKYGGHVDRVDPLT